MSEDQIARVNAIVAGFADVEPGTTYGYPAFKVRDKTFAWFPRKKEVPEGTLGVRMSGGSDARDAALKRLRESRARCETQHRTRCRARPHA